MRVKKLLVGVFLNAAVALWGLTGVFKVWTVVQELPYLSHSAPILPEFTWRQLLLGGAVLEIGCAAYILRHRASQKAGLHATLWLALTLCIFRATLRLIGYTGPCNCLGYIGDGLGLSQQAASAIAWGILLFLLAGSVICLYSLTSSTAISASKALRTAAALSWLGAASELQSSKSPDFKISGHQQLLVIEGTHTSIVQASDFTVARKGNNWFIENTYTNAGSRSYIAFVDGRPYQATWNLVDGDSAGLVLESMTSMLDGAPEFPRVLFTAFLLTPQEIDAAANCPVAFLFPRHPALHCYVWNPFWSSMRPFLPERITFQLDSGLLRRVSDDVVEYFYGAGKKGSRLIREFEKTQKAGALYSVVEWTNFASSSFPLLARLRHVHFDGTKVLERIHLIETAHIEPVNSYSLLPPLSPNAWVQHLFRGTNYFYQTDTGRWLSDQEVTKVGRVKRRAGRPPEYALHGPLYARIAICLLVVYPMVVLLIRRLVASKKRSRATVK